MSRSGDRHLRPEPSGRLKGALLPGPRGVRIIAAEDYAQTIAGQHLLQWLINMLCRQFGVVDAVALDIPRVPVCANAFPGPLRSEDTDLASQLTTLARRIAGDEIVAHGDIGQAQIAIVVGHVQRVPDGPELVVHAIGDGWKAFCSTAEPAPGRFTDSQLPYGPALAASLAAGAAFLFFHQVPCPVSFSGSLWDLQHGPWEGLSNPFPTSIVVPPTYLIGLGAVGAATALCLAGDNSLQGDLIGIDPQCSDETSRNRLVTMMYDEAEHGKVSLAERLFGQSDLRFFGNKVAWPAYVTDGRRVAPESVAEPEARFAYEWVLSCVDKNVHRQAIAAYVPRHILSGATNGMVAQVAYFSMVGTCECLACNHPVPSVNVDELADELRGMSTTDRSTWFDVHDVQPAMRTEIDAFLAERDCGRVGASELYRLGLDGATDWSVGFVSVASGIMLAAARVRTAATGVDTTFGNRAERRLIFWKPEFLQSVAARKAGCLVCGDPARQARFASLWEASVIPPRAGSSLMEDITMRTVRHAPPT